MKVESFGTISNGLVAFANDDATEEQMQSRLYEMISYAKDRFHWYEEQRERKLSLALALGAVSGISFPFIMGDSLNDNPAIIYFT
ncbi:hypothetical protein P7228_11950 [Altererythrobacter arenosus]|uniref:SMODS and SLOG-associating 2TM effector domain-containing protein n=1 Tax=Altererythrobacter arenosus TaxID=3032592 RepID=A0ABY8FNX0_9SPHN|nr:hypothetical protein [Altererythrobacter sp. CAU 1644]WFL76706.1 hypothetical protein P7228_11950 [Altererythrobacter sp. CAU 1644]